MSDPTRWAIVTIGEVPAELDELARAYDAPVIVAASCAGALCALEEIRPRLVLVAVTDDVATVCELVGAIRRYGHAMTVVVAAREHTETLERDVRIAGATYYLPTLQPAAVAPLLDALRRRADHQAALEHASCLAAQVPLLERPATQAEQIGNGDTSPEPASEPHHAVGRPAHQVMPAGTSRGRNGNRTV
jgi:hypothetical protein